MTYDAFKNRLTEEERAIVRCYEKILDATTFPADRDRMRVLEIGSGWGIFARACAEKGCEVLTIDKIPQARRPEFPKNTEGAPGPITAIEDDSHKPRPETLELVKRGCELALVDGDHGYEGCLQDMELAWSAIESGGTMLCDDVFHAHNWDLEGREGKDFDYGTARALWQFLKAHRAEIRGGAILHAVGHGLAQIQKA